MDKDIIPISQYLAKEILINEERVKEEGLERDKGYYHEEDYYQGKVDAFKEVDVFIKRYLNNE